MVAESPTRVVVTGATGRMGQTVLSTASGRGLATLAVSESDPEAVDGAELRDALEPGDVIVDFSIPESSRGYLAAAGESGTPIVVGTTGYEESGEQAIETAAAETAVLRASNFARGIQALTGALREAVSALPGYDIELTETHHNGKRDAPSGTALSLLSEIDAERDSAPERVYGREGHAPRAEESVGVHVRRAGGVHGEHEIMLAGNEEILTLTHRAESREVFAAGALDAAAWLVGRAPGYYGFEEIL